MFPLAEDPCLIAYDDFTCAVCKIGAARLYVEDAFDMPNLKREDYPDSYDFLMRNFPDGLSLFMCSYITPPVTDEDVEDLSIFEQEDKYRCNIDYYY